MESYTRADLLRILRITARQLSSWERAGIIASSENYSFADLIQIKKVHELCAKRVRPATIRQSLEAMQQQVSGMSNPLLEASAFSQGSRVAFRHKGTVVEPVSGQFVMDFASRDSASMNSANVTEAPGGRRLARMKDPMKEGGKGFQSDAEVSGLFARGIAFEEDPDRQVEAIQAYQRVIEIDPEHAAAHINLGTVHYNRQEYGASEFHYRRAVEIDPRYALAYFDLGNVLDETGRVQEAIEAYRNALLLAPTYADAHYNLALAFEKIAEPRRALAHWRSYVKLDGAGPWATHARHQIRKLLAADPLKLVYRRRG